ncbi:hypothetical protein ILYODFUR_011526, partial [Ilyodon furcidens]
GFPHTSLDSDDHLWTQLFRSKPPVDSGSLLPRLASSLLHYLSAQHRSHPSPLDCTSAAEPSVRLGYSSDWM